MQSAPTHVSASLPGSHRGSPLASGCANYFAACFAVCLAACVGGIAPAWADAPDYNTAIAPLLRKYCHACHAGSEHEGQLTLDAHAHVLHGGKHGPAIAPRSSATSLLVRVLTGKEKPAMPPDDEPKPSAEEISVIAAWIDAGALDSPAGAAPVSAALPKIAVTHPMPEPIEALAPSPTEPILAVARFGEVEIIDRALPAANVRPAPIRKFPAHAGRITCMRFSADGKWLVTAAGEPGIRGDAKLWNVADGALVREFRGHGDSLYAAALSPDSSLLATAGYDQQIKLWNTATGAELHTLAGHNDAIYDLAIRPDGRVLASVSGDRTAKLWDLKTGARLDTLSQSLKELYAVAFSPDGRRLVTGGVDNRIRAYDITPDARENDNPLVISRFAHEGPILKLAYSPDGRLLVSASEDKTIKLWDTATLELRGALEPQPDWPAAIAISPDGATLHVGRLDGTLAAYPLGAGAESGPLPARLADCEPPVFYADQLPDDKLPRIAEVEPNDSPAGATKLSVPCVATGRIQPASSASANAPSSPAPGSPSNGAPDSPSSTPSSKSSSAAAGSAAIAPHDPDLFRFEAKAGERWILEINAARSGSQLDSRLEILSADGRPLERAWLRAVRDSELEFRSEDSSDRGMRLANWEEIELDDFVYLEGEVVKQFRQRQGPDSDANFYPEAGPRHTFFDTSPRAHALGVKAYVVAPYAVGSRLPYNGLPVFSLYYDNDDDSHRKQGLDSRLVFTAPADGAYLVRVSDMRGFGGEKFDYQLTIRHPRPDFKLSVDERDLKIAAGSGEAITVRVDRVDDFDGPVEVELSDLPPGFTAASPLLIEAGSRVARGVIFAHPWAPSPAAADWRAVKIEGRAKLADREVRRMASLDKVQLMPAPKIQARIAPPGEGPDLPSGDVDGELAFPAMRTLTIAPGGSATLELSVVRNGFDGIINFEAENLPHGVIVDDIGLNGIQLLEGQTHRTLRLSASRITKEQDRPFALKAKEADGQTSLPLLLRVRQAKP